MPKLMIVDDEQDVREFAANFFRKRKIEVLTEGDGKAAIQTIEEQKPDLVLLDVRMEGMTGVEVLRNLRAKKNNVKVIMVTGVENGDVIGEVQKLGISNYVHKPLVLAELEKIVLAELQKQ